MQKAFRDNLAQEANDFKKKYAETLNMYSDELQEYRSIYENASRNYKDLKVLKTELKKHQVKKMMLDTQIESLERSQTQFMKIQKQMFHTSVVRFAEYYLTYHKKENLTLVVQEKKKEEQHLLKEHLQLAETLKERKRLQQMKPKTSVKSVIAKEEISDEGTSKDTNQCLNKLQKFLDEEILPCSLTSINGTERAPSFNKDNSKVKILDVKMLKPPLRSQKIKKPKVDLRKKMEDIMQTAKNEIRRTNSFRVDSLQSSQEKHNVSVTESQPSKKTVKEIEKSQSQKTVKELEKPQSQKNAIKLSGRSQEVKTINKKPPAQDTNKVTSSQSNMAPKERVSQKLEKVDKMTPSQEMKKPEGTPTRFNMAAKMAPKEMGSQKLKKIDKMNLSQEMKKLEATPTRLNMAAKMAPFDQPKETVTNSILKPSSQEKVSKFFNLNKKKSVSFRPEVGESVRSGGPFQLFGMDEKKSVESGLEVKSMDIFPKSFCFKNDDAKKKEALPEVENQTMECSTNMSFIVDTGASNLVNYTKDTSDEKNEISFDLLDTSTHPGFGQPPLNPAESEEVNTFDFFGSQAKSNNPFKFF